MRYCEDWIESKLMERLCIYKQRYPAFKINRVMLEVETWDAKSQKWSPYMKDADIKSINNRFHRRQSIRSLAINDHL